MLLPKTLFSRTVAIIALVSTAFLIFTISIISYLVLVPVGKQSADDLVSLMTFSARAWTHVSPDKKSDFENYLLNKYQLSISNGDNLKPLKFKSLPYYYFIESSIESSTGQKVTLKVSQDKDGIDWYWANLQVNNNNIYMGFPSTHINAKPPLVLLLLLVVGSIATLVTAAILVRHLTTPLERLSQNALRIGSGEEAELIPEQGAEEMITLAKSFNMMAVQVKELLTNRTTLLAGISHDLRTPLARIQLALEMLFEETDSTLVDEINRDVEQMNCLIGQFLELSKNLEKGEQQNIDIDNMLEDIVSCARRGGAEINWHAKDKCQVITNPMALRRIIVNLLENAVRYGEGHSVDVDYTCNTAAIIITINDRGNGIPEDQLEAVFRPFHRLDQSRNSATGGTGLGLSIARQLADINNIKLQLSARKNMGTTAQITIHKT